MTRLYFLILIFLSVSGLAQDQWKNVYKESAWKERDEWQKPDELIKRLGIKAGSKVADIGCNEGYMTVKLSKAVGKDGKVYAVDVSQLKLDALEDHLKERSIDNVVVIKGDYDDPKLEPNSMDAVIILDTYHEMDDHDKILAKVKMALKSDGRLVICEPIAEGRRKLDRGKQESAHELGIDFALKDLEKAGYHILFQKDPFADRTKVKGDNMWIIAATK